ncbi:succinic semialdehyde dehydrogenase [Micromonospora sp. NPDC023888]|uniref:succinic semialdehyde dehydrogenase n=1 Tax=Micromonospora sp. NPDC023888 TaxID=3155607 RepID=UPI0033F726BB
MTETTTGCPARVAAAVDELGRIAADSPRRGARQIVSAPFTGAPLVEVGLADKADVRAAFDAARPAQQAWARLDHRSRARPFIALHDALFRRQGEILDLIQVETGKARAHAFEELLDAASITLYYARRAGRFLAPRRRSGAIPLFTRAREARLPRGTVAVITPWNYPLALGLADVVPALLAGNAVVHKPDTQTTLSTRWAWQVLVQAGLPPDVWQVLPGDPAEMGETLIAHADSVCFTGSTTAGRAVGRAAADQPVPCTLELGGKNAMVVLPDADVAAAVRGVLRAAFTSAGQLCMATERVLVAEPLMDRLLPELVSRVRRLRLGAGFDFDVDMGSLTTPRQLARVIEHVEDARSRGATVLTGGRARPDLGPLFYEPTVLTGVVSGMKLHREETFGPVLSVRSFRTEQEAIDLVNDTDYGLTASIWSRNVRHARRLAGDLRTGLVNINEGFAAAYGSHDAPAGGVKGSGVGVRHGRDGLLAFTRPQTVASQHVVTFDRPDRITAENHARLLTAVFRTLKATRMR